MEGIGRMNPKRGYVPDDDRNFSASALELLRTASRHVEYLINEGYDLKQASTFVGNHFLLSDRQRLAIMRSLATKEQLKNRRMKEKQISELAGSEVWIDGFNIIITLEILACDSLLFSCMDGTVRDLASLRGTYRIIPETETAVQMLFDALEAAEIRSATILLDQPVSNSGRLKALAAGIGSQYPFDLDIQIIRDVDRNLYGKENVISSDSIILDRCSSWFNLVGTVMEKHGKTGICVWQSPDLTAAY